MYSISKAATAAQVKVSTLRFYERKGLVKSSSKTVAGYRFYSDADIHKVIFIKNAQLLGFSLAEIKSFLGFSQNQTTISRKNIEKVAVAKVTQIELKIRSLQRMKKAIAGLMRAPCDLSHECPVVLSLQG